MESIRIDSNHGKKKNTPFQNAGASTGRGKKLSISAEDASGL